jgi:Putative viral replication protein
MSAKQWSFTLNNYTEVELLALSDIENITACEYILFGKEIAPETQTPHLQGFIHFSKRMTRVQVLHIIP